METIKLRTHIGEDGVLKFEMPVGITNVDADIVVVFNVERREKEDWETFINRTYGILADDPIERPEQPPTMSVMKSNEIPPLT